MSNENVNLVGNSTGRSTNTYWSQPSPLIPPNSMEKERKSNFHCLLVGRFFIASKFTIRILFDKIAKESVFDDMWVCVCVHVGFGVCV